MLSEAASFAFSCDSLLGFLFLISISSCLGGEPALYPHAWQKQVLSSELGSVTFPAVTGELAAISRAGL